MFNYFNITSIRFVIKDKMYIVFPKAFINFNTKKKGIKIELIYSIHKFAHVHHRYTIEYYTIMAMYSFSNYLYSSRQNIFVLLFHSVSSTIPIAAYLTKRTPLQYKTFFIRKFLFFLLIRNH